MRILLRRCVLLTLFLELATTLLRQVFDFLGYMWLPILLNFFNILLVILGLFGVQESRKGYLGLYLGWTPLWIAWNTFLIAFYKDLGRLDSSSSSEILALGTGSFSWWLINGLGCNPHYSFEAGRPPLRPQRVEGCKVSYQDVEAGQAGVQVILGTLGLVLGGLSIVLLQRTTNGGSSSSSGGNNNRSMYSIEYSPKSSGPNTPRRTKRRSHHNSGRFSQRNSASAKRQNPVNRLMESFDPPDSSRPNSLYGAMIGGGAKAGEGGVSHQLGTTNRCPSSLTSYSNFHQQRRALPAPVGLLSVDLLHGNNEGDDLPLPPPPAALNDETGTYCETQTLYAGEGAIPKRLPPVYSVEPPGHGPGCVCASCQRKMTAI